MLLCFAFDISFATYLIFTLERRGWHVSQKGFSLDPHFCFLSFVLWFSYCRKTQGMFSFAWTFDTILAKKCLPNYILKITQSFPFVFDVTFAKTTHIVDMPQKTIRVFFKIPHLILVVQYNTCFSYASKYCRSTFFHFSSHLISNLQRKPYLLLLRKIQHNFVLHLVLAL